MSKDPLAALLDFPEISESCAQALQNVDQLSWNRTVRRHKDYLIPYCRRISGFATAALDGAQMPSDPTMEPESSPMGKLSEKGLLVTAEADLQVLAFKTEPLKVWARLNTIASSSPDRGQPRISNEVIDPLRLGNLPNSQVLQDRLWQLTDVILESKAPAILIAAIAHAELATLRPFTEGSYLIARATSRLVLAARDVDPDGVVMSEYGAQLIGRPAYVKALTAYMTGTREGLTSWVNWQTTAISRGIEMAEKLAISADTKN